MMKQQVVWFVMNESGIERMTKRQPASLYRSEHAVKITVRWDTRALSPPTLEREVVIEDWRQGLDVSDVDFKQATITETEADIIRAARREAMVAQMRELGYVVIPPGES